MVFNNNLLIGAASASAVTPGAGYTIDNSCIFNDDDSAYLYRTPGGDGNLKTWTVSFWMKRANLGGNMMLMTAGTSTVNKELIRIDSSTDKLSWILDVSSAGKGTVTTDMVFRDPTAWYHIVVSKDAANAQVFIYVNGSVVTTTTSVAIADVDGYFNATETQGIGGRSYSAGQYFDGYFTEFIMIDGSELLPSSFGEFNSDGVWIPVDPSALTFGTNGFWLDFEDSSDLGNDVSGNANDFTSVSMSASNQTLDTPTDSGTTIGNFCTWNPLLAGVQAGTNPPSFSEGNLQVDKNGSGTWRGILGNIEVTSGKWYCELTITLTPKFCYFGVVPIKDFHNNTSTSAGSFSYAIDGDKFDGSTALSYGDTYTTGDVIGMAFDMDNAIIWFSKNGTWQNSATIAEVEAGTTTNAAYSGGTLNTTPKTIYWAGYDNTGAGLTLDTNTGQRAFSYTVPTGFTAWATPNIAAPTVTKPTDQFLPILYEGNGTGQRVGNFIPFTDTFAVDESGRFDTGDNDNLYVTPSTTRTSDTTYTVSLWFKRGKIGFQCYLWKARDAAVGNSALFLNSSNVLEYSDETSGAKLKPTRLFEQTDAWTNIIIVFDSTNATAGDRARMYINGVRETNFTTETMPAEDDTDDVWMANGVPTYLLAPENATGERFDGYVAEFVYTDGQALTASSFGETDTSTNRWIPKDVSGLTFGNAGFYLDFASANDLGNDISGNSQDFTMSAGMDATNGSNQMYGTPSQNFAVMDEGSRGGQSAALITITQGNLTCAAGDTNNKTVYATMRIPATGKWYYEWYVDDNGATQGQGLRKYGTVQDGGVGSDSNARIFLQSGNKADGTSVSYGSSWSNGDVIGIAVDMDNGAIYFAVNDTWQDSGDPESGSSKTGAAFTDLLNGYIWMPEFESSGSPNGGTFNFGQWRYFDGATLSLDSDAGGYFRYTAPTDYLALQQDNLAANTAGITGFSWIKNREAADNHILQNRVEGIYNYVSSNLDVVEATNTNSVQRFLQQGVQIGNFDEVNTSAESFVLWQWANDGAETSNGDGAITTTIRANTDAGFSMGTYTGDNAAVSSTIGHGLGAAPEFVILKALESNPSWTAWHTDLTAGKGLQLDNSGGEISPSGGHIGAVSSTTITLTKGSSNNNAVNLAEEYVFYAFAPIEGYSFFGSYIGNQDNDGPYSFVGFAVAWVMIKESDGSGSNWHIYDNKRRTYNPNTVDLNADLAFAESYNAADIDLLASGFKIRTVGTGTNEDGKTYIYAAFAENPFGGSGVAQARAR